MNEIPTIIYQQNKRKRTPLHPVKKLLRAVTAGSLLLALLFLLTAPSHAPAVNVTGVWEGKVVQDPGGIFEVYPFRVLLYQHDGQISGASHIWLPNDDTQYGIINIEGTVENGVVHLTETAILEQELYSEWRWCLKSAELTLENNVLSGRWTAPGCVSGYLELTQVSGE